MHRISKSNKNIKTAFFLNLIFTVVEIIGGFMTNSVAILSDALHDLGDSLSLGFAWWISKYSEKKKDKTFSFGYRRFSLLGALVNSLVLIGGSVFIIYMALERFINPEQPHAEGMIGFAIAGIIVNGYAAWKVSSGKTLNEKVVSWHLLEDVLGWIAVLIVAIVLLFKEVPYLDPALSLLITLYVLWNVIKRLKETLFIFLQGVPDEFAIDEIETDIRALDKVQSVHDTHVWSMDGERHVLSMHVKLEKINSWKEVLECKKAVKRKLKEYPLHTVTIETEFDEETCFNE